MGDLPYFAARGTLARGKRTPTNQFEDKGGVANNSMKKTYSTNEG